MSLKLVLALAFVAVCSAQYLGADKYYVDVGKEYITIAGYGKKVNFLVDKYYGYEGPQTILVQFHAPGIPSKTVQYLDKEGMYQGEYQNEILYQIFRKYEGPLDDIELEKLVDDIRRYVKDNEIHPAILYVLEALRGQYEALTYLDKYEGLYQETPYEKYGILLGKKGYRKGFSGSYPYYMKEDKYDVAPYYPGKYGAAYGKGYGEFYPYGENVYQNIKGDYGYGSGFGQKYYGSYGPYATQAYKYGKGIYGDYGYGKKSYDLYSMNPYGYETEYPEKYYGGLYSPYAAGKTYKYDSYYPKQYSGYMDSYLGYGTKQLPYEKSYY